MKRTLLGWTSAVVVAGLAVAALVYMGAFDRREWTTDSKPALEAFQRGLDERMRFYPQDAMASFRRALEADPQFAAARVQLVELEREAETRQAHFEILATVDRRRLTERERFLVDLSLAWRDKDQVRVRHLARQFVERHPRDPWGLSMVAAQAWDDQDWSRAEQLFGRLLAVEPNWVLARNNLGYLAMAQGRFADAEQHFQTYAYAAPDQANPHDSLGELYVLLGRYDEARAQLEQALEVRPDFCASYGNLIAIAMLEGRSEAFGPILDRVDAHCEPAMAERMRCQARMIEAFLERDYEAPWREAIDRCLPGPRERGVMFHRLALLTGRDDLAREQEEAVAALAAKDYATTGKRQEGANAIELHLRGVRQLAEGRNAEAAESLRAADRSVRFWGLGDGRFKLLNKMTLAIALERVGDAAGAAAALAEVAQINPEYARRLPQIAERTPGPARRGR